MSIHRLRGVVGHHIFAWVAAHIDTPICFGQRLDYFLELGRLKINFFF